MRTVTLVGADGSRHVVACPNGAALQLGPAPALWGIAPHAFASSRVANIPGERLDDVHPVPRIIPLPIKVFGSDPDDLDTQLGALGSILSPDLPVVIEFDRGDGTSRAITVHCVDGADQVVVDDYEEDVARLPLVFKAFDPWWRAIDADAAEYEAVFADGLLAGSNAVELTNVSDVPRVWPEIIITGQIVDVSMGNLETGQVIRVNATIGVDDELRIVTDPARRDVWLNGSRDWSVIDQEVWEPWPLVPGLNRLVVRGYGTGGGGAIGSFKLRWSPRFQTC